MDVIKFDHMVLRKYSIFSVIYYILAKIAGEGNGNSLQYSCWENPVDRGISMATVHGVATSQTQLSN